MPFEDIYVIHDPAEGFTAAGSYTFSKKLVIIVPFGHALLSRWATKRDGAPAFSTAMPVFDYDEIVANKDNLFHGYEITDEDLVQKYKKFGGSIRHWMSPTEDEAWKELVAKIFDVAKHGTNITGRTTNHRGSIVHVSVDFDSKRPVYPVEGFNKFRSGA